MRRRPKVRQTSPVSLFPFLAVLICTFGVLIILLVIVVKAAEHQAKDSSIEVEQQHAESIAELSDEIEFQQFRAEALRGLRPDLLKQLQNERSRRAHLQADIDKLNDDAKLLNNEIDLVSNESAVVDQTQLIAELNDLDKQLATEKQSLQESRKLARANQPTKYSVVPTDGSNGTERRPIYIECLDDEFVIQPYGIELSARDFVRPIVANNPLDAALVAVREYFLENNLSEAGQTPYPLLIVRPEGAGSYGIARHAIKSWDEEFGYELISAEKELDFGQPDLQLKDKLLEAVNAARQRQQDYFADQALNRNRSTVSNQSSGGLHASNRHGGFVSPKGIRRSTADRKRLPGARKTLTKLDDSDNIRGRSETGAEKEADIAIESLQAEGDSIASERGKDWAIPSKNENAVAYYRPLKLLVTDNELMLDCDSSFSRQVRIPFKLYGDSAKTVEALVSSIWQRIDSWGVAGVNGYWKPELVVDILPGGETRYSQLVQLLNDSGIEIRKVTR